MITTHQSINQKDIEELISIFYKQVKLQQKISYNNDQEPVLKIYNSATAAMIELMEMLQENTYWKKYVTGSEKTPVCNIDNFVEEYCDALIYMMNIAIYANIDISTIIQELSNKQKINFDRFGIK